MRKLCLNFTEIFKRNNRTICKIFKFLVILWNMTHILELMGIILLNYFLYLILSKHFYDFLYGKNGFAERSKILARYKLKK